MAYCQTKHVALRGIASAVPDCVLSARDVPGVGEAEIAKIVASTGISERRIAPTTVCASDLCQAAAERLLHELDWSADSVDALVFTSQTPDHILPATSCLLQSRLGLATQCAAFDLNLGCSGFVYGLWVASRLVGPRGIRRVLLLAGDTVSRLAAPQDRSTTFLFGDAGTATALEYTDEESPMDFVLGTDGSGGDQLLVPAGGFRQRRNAKTACRSKREDGNVRSEEDLHMNGAEVFAFTLREVPALIENVLERAGWSPETVDHVVMHQASAFILKHIARRLRLPREKWVQALDHFGNTSCASIPLAISDSLRETLQETTARVVLAGFGVGFSWGAVALPMGPAVLPPLVCSSEWSDAERELGAA